MQQCAPDLGTCHNARGAVTKIGSSDSAELILEWGSEETANALQARLTGQEAAWSRGETHTRVGLQPIRGRRPQGGIELVGREGTDETRPCARRGLSERLPQVRSVIGQLRERLKGATREKTYAWQRRAPRSVSPSTVLSDERRIVESSSEWKSLIRRDEVGTSERGHGSP